MVRLRVVTPALILEIGVAALRVPAPAVGDQAPRQFEGGDSWSGQACCWWR